MVYHKAEQTLHVLGFFLNKYFKSLVVSVLNINDRLKTNEMPIEIKELHIKINVDEKTATTTSAASVDEAQIMRAVSESVEQAVKIEQRKKER